MYNNLNCKSNFFHCLELRPAALFQYENQFCPLRVTEMNSVLSVQLCAFAAPGVSRLLGPSRDSQQEMAAGAAV